MHVHKQKEECRKGFLLLFSLVFIALQPLTGCKEVEKKIILLKDTRYNESDIVKINFAKNIRNFTSS